MCKQNGKIQAPEANFQEKDVEILFINGNQ
jgi:hypothetical protein